MAETAPWDRAPEAAAPWARPAGQEAAPWERPQDAFGAAAARTYQAVKPTGGRKESDVTKLPEEVTSKLATDLMEMPFRAASAPMRALTGKLQVNDPETGMPTREAISEAQGVAGMAMGGSMGAPKGSIGAGPPLKPPERIHPEVAKVFPEATVNQRGDHVLPLAGDKGAVEFKVNPDTVVMSASYLDKAERGKGIASNAYREIVDWALASGRKVRSHGAPQPDARKLYESLSDKGYQVERSKNLAGQTEYTITGGPASSERVGFQSAGARRGEASSAAPRPAPIAETPEAAAARKADMKAAFDKLIGGGKETPKPVLDPSAGRVGFQSTGTKKGPTLGAGLKSVGVAVAQALKPIERILSPTTVSPIAGRAEGMIRSASGGAARSEAVTAAAIEPWQRAVNAMPAPDRLNFLDYVEGRSGQYAGLQMRDPHMQGLADVLKDSFESRMQKLQNLPSTSSAAFIGDYFPHFWKDPNKAAAAASTFGTGAAKQGSRASLSKRTVPTISDGIAMGLEPLTTNPLEATMMYVRSMDHFIAAQGVLDEAKAQGTIKYIKPKTMGASGHPDSYRVPDGWVPLNGRGATDRTGAQAYAPEDFARVYNNYIDRGVHKNADWGNLYDAAQKTSNAITSMELGLSGYHAFTMANEAIISDVAKGISELVGGKPIRALGSIAKAPTAPVTQYMKGKKVEQAYLGHSAATPDMRNIADLLEKAGGRAVGKRHAADYTFSQMGSYWTSFKRGALKQEMQQSAANIRAAPVTGTAKEGAKTIGRIMETVAQPLFEKYIPRIKNGAFYDTMQQWIDAHPAAPQAEMEQAARQIWDSIDNRFGEVVQDNIFWSKALKQVAQLGLRSYSWNLGTIREIGGGVKDIAATAARQQEWSPRASYVVALPIVVATVNAVYQKLMSGKNPESVDDLMLGRTGGQVPGFGGRGQVPERASTPGYQKDVMGWYENWRQEAANKIASGPRAAVIDPLRGVDWKGDPIFHEGTPWLQDYFTHVLQAMEPISVKSLLEKPKTGSKISTAQKLMGIREAPIAMEDKPGAKRFHAYQSRQSAMKEWRGKVRDAQKHGQPPPPMPANINAPFYQE